MAVLLAYKKKDQAKVNSFGDNFDLGLLLIALSKNLSERMAREKSISLEQSDALVANLVKEGLGKMNKGK